MENENIKNDNNDINELVDRAMNDINQADKNEESKDETAENSEIEEDNFNGDFHEKDSSTANDIVSPFSYTPTTTKTNARTAMPTTAQV